MGWIRRDADDRKRPAFYRCTLSNFPYFDFVFFRKWHSTEVTDRRYYVIVADSQTHPIRKIIQHDGCMNDLSYYFFPQDAFKHDCHFARTCYNLFFCLKYPIYAHQLSLFQSDKRRLVYVFDHDGQDDLLFAPTANK